MLNSNRKDIEDAFIKIRAEFENRDNQKGLEFLESFEEQWAATGWLSDRQLDWLQRQLDGSWKEKAKPVTDTTVDDGCTTPAERTDINPIPRSDQNLKRLLDAMIQRKLEELLK